MEIFSTYGKIKMIDMPVERMHPHLSKGYAYVEFENPDEAEKALKHMDGGKSSLALTCLRPAAHHTWCDENRFPVWLHVRISLELCQDSSSYSVGVSLPKTCLTEHYS